MLQSQFKGQQGQFLISEDQLAASICRESFYDFVKEFWEIIIPEKPVWNWHIKYLCNEIQYVSERVFKWLPVEHDLIINISPGSTKSTIASVMLTPWVWTRMPSARLICASYTSTLAWDLSRKSRDVVKSDKYRSFFPEIKLRKDQDTKSYFANTLGGSRYSVGVGGSVMGMHGHILTIDDPVDPTQAISEAEMKTANAFLTDTLPTRVVEKGVVPTILIMQRLHEDDPTNKMIEVAKRRAEIEGTEVKLKHICLPAEKTKHIKPLKLRQKYKDGLMDPVRLPMEVLKTFQAKGQYMYASQFLQWPVPAAGGMFKFERIEVDVVPKKASIIEKVRFWDKAASKDAGAYSVGVLMCKDSRGRFGVLDVKRGQWSSEVREEIIKQTASIDGDDTIIGIEQEPGSGGKESVENTVKNLAGFRVRIDRPTGNKIERADPYSVQVNNGNVFITKGDWNDAYLNELQFFPFSKYKDQVDASSGAFNILNRVRKVIGALR